jgi:DNA-binding Xre family transcriptional regulator
MFFNCGGESMTFSYNKLWKMLIDKKLLKKDLMAMTSMTSSTMAKMGKDLPVSMEVLARICKVLNCNIGDIVDVIKKD